MISVCSSISSGNEVWNLASGLAVRPNWFQNVGCGKACLSKLSKGTLVNYCYEKIHKYSSVSFPGFDMPETIGCRVTFVWIIGVHL